MSIHQTNSPFGEGDEQRLWDYIDGLSSPSEKSVIDELIEANGEWKAKYHELLEVHQLMQSSELEEPSMRFTKNVMERIAQVQVAPATRNYINRNVIRGIMAFFFILIAGIIVYLVGKTQWTGSASDTFLSSHRLNPDKLNWARTLGSLPVNVFILVNVVLGLFLLDKYLQQKKKSRHEDGTAYGSGS